MDDHTAKDLTGIPYAKRMILLPRCLSSNLCTAPRKMFGEVECQRCGAIREDGSPCPIKRMIEIAEEIGYGDIRLFAGGSGIIRFMKVNGFPKGLLAVACEPEIREGKEKVDEKNIPLQVAYLTKDGCAETDFTDGDVESEWRRVLTEQPE